MKPWKNVTHSHLWHWTPQMIQGAKSLPRLSNHRVPIANNPRARITTSHAFGAPRHSRSPAKGWRRGTWHSSVSLADRRLCVVRRAFAQRAFVVDTQTATHLSCCIVHRPTTECKILTAAMKNKTRRIPNEENCDAAATNDTKRKSSHCFGWKHSFSLMAIAFKYNSQTWNIIMSIVVLAHKPHHPTLSWRSIWVQVSSIEQSFIVCLCKVRRRSHFLTGRQLYMLVQVHETHERANFQYTVYEHGSVYCERNYCPMRFLHFWHKTLKRRIKPPATSDVGRSTGKSLWNLKPRTRISLLRLRNHSEIGLAAPSLIFGRAESAQNKLWALMVIMTTCTQIRAHNDRRQFFASCTTHTANLWYAVICIVAVRVVHAGLSHAPATVDVKVDHSMRLISEFWSYKSNNQDVKFVVCGGLQNQPFKPVL